MAEYKRAMIIVNPAAGKPEPVLSILNDVLGPAKIDWQVAVTQKSGDGAEHARKAIAEGFDLIGVYGGDGSVSEVASALAEGGPPLLLLPGGTGNALADDLGIPPGLADAAALALEGASRIRRIDMGRAGDTYFVLRLTMGIEASLVCSATREMKDRFGWLAYLMSGLQALADPQIAEYTITVDGESFVVEGVAAMIANSASVGHLAGVKLAQGVELSDGCLVVAIVETTGLPGLLGTVADAAQGQEPSGVQRWSGSRIRLDAKPAQVILADGEESGTTPVDVTVIPGAVGVLVPLGQS